MLLRLHGDTRKLIPPYAYYFICYLCPRNILLPMCPQRTRFSPVLVRRAPARRFALDMAWPLSP